MLCLPAFSAARTADTVRLLVHHDSRLELSGFYLAMEKGYYRGLDIRLEIIQYPQRRPLIPLLQSQTGDFAIVSPLFLRHYAQGIPLLSFLPLYQQTPYAFALINPEVNTDSTRDVNTFLNAFLCQNADDSLAQSITTKETDHSHVLQNMRMVHLGREAYALAETPDSLALQLSEEYGLDLYGNILVGLDTQMGDNSDRTRRFIEATRMGFRTAIANPLLAAETVRKHQKTPVTLDTLIAEAEMFAYLNQAGNVVFGDQSQSRWHSQVHALFQAGLISEFLDVEGLIATERMFRESRSEILEKNTRLLALAGLLLVASLVFFNFRLRRSVQKQTNELRESQQRLELALHSASDGVWERPDHREDRIWMSQRVYEMLGIVNNGYAPTYSGFCSFIYPEDLLHFRLAQNSVVNADSRFEVEMRINTVRGWRWFRLRGGILNNGTGGRRISAVLQDIQDARQSMETLKLNEARLRQYFEVGLVGMAMLDSNGNILHINTVLAEWLGSSTEACIGKNWRNFTYKDDIPLEVMLFEELTQGKRDSYRLDKRLIRLDNARIWNGLQAMRRIDDDRDTHQGSVVMSVLDVSDRYTTRAEQERLAHLMSLKNRTLETTLHAISHDFRKPLDRLREAIETLNISPAQMTVIGQELGLLEQMLNALLKLSRLGTHQSEHKSIEMTGLVNSVIQEMSEKIHHADAEICVFNLPACVGDEIQLYQVFANLLENTLRFRDPGRRCSVVISGEDVPEWVRFHVRDNGIGIPLRNLELIRTPFFSTAPTTDSENKGMGIGLAAVARIVENHGGTLKIQSETGKWTEVTITLPKA